MKLVIISTVGASLIINYARHTMSDPNRFLDSIESMDEQEIEKWIKEIYIYITRYIDDYSTASAELSSIFSILKKMDLSGVEEIELMFIISDTPQGKLVNGVLERFFMEYLKEYNGVPIKYYHDVAGGLTYVDVEHVEQGLPNVPILISQWIRNKMASGCKVILNVTGGFKAECVYAAFVGILAGIPTYYMHEKFREVVRLPPIPESLVNVSKEQIGILLHLVEKFYLDLKEKYRTQKG